MLNLSAIAHGSSSCESQPCNYVLKLCWNLLESMLSKKKDSHSRNVHVPLSTNKYTHADSGSFRSCIIFRVMSPHVLIVAVPQCLGRFDVNINTYQYYLAIWSIYNIYNIYPYDMRALSPESPSFNCPTLRGWLLASRGPSNVASFGQQILKPERIWKVLNTIPLTSRWLQDVGSDRQCMLWNSLRAQNLGKLRVTFLAALWNWSAPARARKFPKGPASQRHTRHILTTTLLPCCVFMRVLGPKIVSQPIIIYQSYPLNY